MCTGCLNIRYVCPADLLDLVFIVPGRLKKIAHVGTSKTFSGERFFVPLLVRYTNCVSIDTLLCIDRNTNYVPERKPDLYIERDVFLVLRYTKCIETVFF